MHSDMTQAIRLLLADDHELIRAGLRSLISGFADVDVVGSKFFDASKKSFRPCA